MPKKKDFVKETIKNLEGEVGKFLDQEDVVGSMNDCKQAVEIIEKLYSIQERREQAAKQDEESKEKELVINIDDPESLEDLKSESDDDLEFEDI